MIPKVDHDYEYAKLRRAHIKLVDEIDALEKKYNLLMHRITNDLIKNRTKLANSSMSDEQTADRDLLVKMRTELKEMRHGRKSLTRQIGYLSEIIRIKKEIGQEASAYCQYVDEAAGGMVNTVEYSGNKGFYQITFMIGGRSAFYLRNRDGKIEFSAGVDGFHNLIDHETIVEIINRKKSKMGYL